MYCRQKLYTMLLFTLTQQYDIICEYVTNPYHVSQNGIICQLDLSITPCANAHPRIHLHTGSFAFFHSTDCDSWLSMTMMPCAKLSKNIDRDDDMQVQYYRTLLCLEMQKKFRWHIITFDCRSLCVDTSPTFYVTNVIYNDVSIRLYV